MSLGYFCISLEYNTDPLQSWLFVDLFDYLFDFNLIDYLLYMNLESLRIQLQFDNNRLIHVAIAIAFEIPFGVL